MRIAREISGKWNCIFMFIFVGMLSLWCVSRCISMFLVLWWFVEPMTKLDGKIVMWTHDSYGMNLIFELLFCFLSMSIMMNWFDVWFKCYGGRIIKEYYFSFLC